VFSSAWRILYSRSTLWAVYGEVSILPCHVHFALHTLDKSVPGGFFLITYFFPVLSVS